MKAYSMKQELSRVFFVAVAFSALLAASVVAWYAEDRFRTTMVMHEEETTEKFAARASLAILTTDRLLLKEYADGVMRFANPSQSPVPQIIGILVTDPKFNVLFETGGIEVSEDIRYDLRDIPERNTLRRESDGYIDVVTKVKARIDREAVPGMEDSTTFGFLLLRFNGRATEEWITRLRIVAALSGIAFGGIILLWLHYRISRVTTPLLTLVQAMAASGATAETLVTPSGPAELQEIAEAYNAMMLKIRSAHRELEDAVTKATKEASAALALAEQESRAKSDLLTRVSHEFRQPLNNIQAYTHTVLHKLRFVGDPISDIFEDVSRIARNTRQLNHLVEDLLLVRQMALDGVEAHYTLFNVHALIDEVLAESQPLNELRGNRVEVNLIGQEQFFGDKKKIKIVLNNLVGNSAKFTENGRIVISSDVTDEAMVIQIADTGIGIDPSAQLDIFAMFQRGPATQVRGYAGIGVGLWIVKELIGLMKGTMTFSSYLNGGTTFFIRIPVATSQT